MTWKHAADETRPSRLSGRRISWRALVLLLAVGLTIPRAGAEGAAESDPRVVPTFQCVGLYWRTPSGATDRTCEVYFRAEGNAEWREALPLWFDANEHAEQPGRSREYRGSIVGLEPATTYEIRLVLAGLDQERRLTVRTWDDRFKVARTVELPERVAGTYTIREGGSAEAGYVVYTPPAGNRTLIDGRGEDEVNIRVEASHVIVRGLDLRGARRHGVDLGAVSDVVIEDCDISGWGENLDDGWGRNFDSAIHHATTDGEPRTLRRIVIQNNRLHHPRSNSNSWLQPRASRKGSRHPIGPQAISFINGDGEIVIRHNEIFSDFDHMFNDAMGEYHNFGYAGFPGRDSDIYGNRVSHCWDDGLEIEGANMNVRVWANVIDRTFDGIGGAVTSLGPCYVFRNVYLRSQRGPGDEANARRGQYFLKLGADAKNAHLARGRLYVFHNTVLQPPAEDGSPAGASRGLYLTARDKHQTNIVGRNNLLWLRQATGEAVFDGQHSPDNDFNHDLFNGTVEARPDSEAAGIRAVPVFTPPLDLRRSWAVALASGSPGHDAAMPLPNFNDGFSGNAPDVGAFEAGQAVPPDFPAASGQPDDAVSLSGVAVRSDIPYLPAGRAEKLDLYFPPGWTAGARSPAVVWVHGGGWVNGGKAGTRERSVCHAFAAAGFVCASVDYRLGKEGAWPKNLLDVKNAVRYLRAHADELGVDPDRIAVAGGSAGGHLALMIAYTTGEGALEPEAPYAGVSSAVRCVIDFYGITNLRTRRQTEADGTITDRLRAGGPASVFGTTEPGAEIFRVASPVEYVSPRTPPTLILHGRADATVDHGQALELARVLEQHGVPYELVLLDGVGHTFDFEGWNYCPLPRDVRSVAIEFLQRHTGLR